MRPRFGEGTGETKKLTGTPVARGVLHEPQPEFEGEMLDCVTRGGIASVVEKVMMQINLYRADIGAGAAERTRKGQMGKIVAA